MTATATDTKTYTVDPYHSTARFNVRHLMVSKVHGSIDEITGSLELDPANPEGSRVEASMALSSLATGNEQRDAHLKSADFFDVEQFPTIGFKSTKIVKKGENEYEVTGDLTIHGVTRPITFQAELTDEIASPFGGFKVGVSLRGKLNREDFGMGWNQVIEAGGVMVGKEVSFEVDAEFDRPA